jgi:ubiquinone/menaquinone biosynthesis C-methylase UbiE
VLEIGGGSGLNLLHYPIQVTDVTVIDPNPGMIALTEKRLDDVFFPVETLIATAEQLDFADNTFDTVVSTWTLCSIPDVNQALDEIYRVLKPDGQFLFVEHGLSPDPQIRTWQHRLNPLQKNLFDGCHLNRDHQTLVQLHGFALNRQEQFYAPGWPKLLGYTYLGIATK